MPAVVTDQFRILNASNFVDTVTGIGGTDPSSSFYVSVSLPNPTVVGFGRTSTWDTATPNPVDNINNVNHIGDTTLFGKRVIGKFGWCDFCSSLANKDNQYLIQNKGAVANYMSKPEIGLINGGCFSKQPFPSPNLPHLPSNQDLRLEPLGAM